MKKRITGVLAGLSLLLAAGVSQALPVKGTSGGSFSNLSSCDNSGSDKDCRIVNTGNGPNTQVQWGSTSSRHDFVNPSVLTSVDVNINTDTNGGGLGVAIARLDWYNSATLRQSSSLDSFGVKWTFDLGFSSPSGPDAKDSEAFDLTIKNPINPVGDSTYGFGLWDLTNITNSISLAGITMSNLRYAVVDGAGAGSSWFRNNVWYNDECNWSSLYILADFTSKPVPEPGTLALLGLGVFGMAAAARKKKSQARA